MDDRMTRRTVIGILGAIAVPLKVSAMPEVEVPQRPPAIAGETVKAFVGAGHGDLEKTKLMLAENPGLLNATWDWGGGDFETALGGAGHMGRRDIAEFLIGQGARADVFVHAMLGDLEVVKSMLTRFPNLKDAKGPHGITLKRHAEMGKEDAKKVLEYLEKLG
jgi:hypothetical protein